MAVANMLTIDIMLWNFHKFPPKPLKLLHDQPAVHRGEETIEDIGEVKDKDGDDAEPLQVDLELVVEAEEAQVDDHISECHWTKLQNVISSAM